MKARHGDNFVSTLVNNSYRHRTRICYIILLALAFIQDPPIRDRSKAPIGSRKSTSRYQNVNVKPLPKPGNQFNDDEEGPEGVGKEYANGEVPSSRCHVYLELR